MNTYPRTDTTNETQGVTRDKLLGVGSVDAGRGTGGIADFPVEASRALGAAGGPELTQLAAKLLASGGPVVGDVIAELLDVALEVHLVLLEPADVELLSRGAALELASEVLFVVSNDSIEQPVSIVSFFSF